jgi:hypothetical protein
MTYLSNAQCAILILPLTAWIPRPTYAEDGSSQFQFSHVRHHQPDPKNKVNGTFNRVKPNPPRSLIL